MKVAGLFSKLGPLTAGVLFAGAVFAFVRYSAGTPAAAQTPPPQPRMPERVTPYDPDEVPANSCEYHKAQLRIDSYGSGHVKNPVYLSEAGQGMTCLTTLANNMKDKLGTPNSVYDDDKYANYIAHAFLGGYGPDGKGVKLGTQANGSVCQEKAWFHFTSPVKDVCTKGYFYFDNDCKVVPEATALALCGSAPLDFLVHYIKSSPISLLWDGETDIERSAAIVKFPLAPAGGNEWCVWKAGPRTPLVVYDPQHTGRIRAADRLFGNWTFGGQPVAASAGAAPFKPQPWKDGYQALGALDADGSGRIEGGELAPLGLWFDNNRDGISQDGEVRSMSQAGVTALYFRDALPDGSGNIRAELGYEREAGGKKIEGASVDWYGETAGTPQQILAGYLGQTEPLGRALLNQPAAAETRPAKANSTDTFRGIWAWRFDNVEGGDARSAHGYLMMDEYPEQNAMAGYSLVEEPFKKSPGGKLSSRAMAFMIQGEKRTDENGQALLAFSSSSSGSVMKSTAQLTDNGRGLKGESTVTFMKDAMTRTVSYTWQARRLD